ncbi:TauD/TfdA family dioxygenase [Thiocystis minor]|uniref:TauD/TfdA family dioxygenase n=1 Tax=Thiocystis minor TaxID=61597 RepID=UPI0019125EE9
MRNPFDLADEAGYREWRARKLSCHPASLRDLHVPIEPLERPSAAECVAPVTSGQSPGRTIRPDSIGPVFSVQVGCLHLRYSSRGRNVRWRESPATDAARRAFEQLFSQAKDFTFNLRMQSGDGVIAHNVLHNRSGFTEDRHATERRLLYRVRYLDRIAYAPDTQPARMSPNHEPAPATSIRPTGDGVYFESLTPRVGAVTVNHAKAQRNPGRQSRHRIL